MAGLDYEQLPAKKQQDPSAILGSYQKQTYDHLRAQYDNEAQALGQATMTDRDFKRSVNQLNTKYTSKINTFKLRSQQETQQLQQVQSLVDQGNITPEAGREAMWRMVLPQETQRAMFSSQRETSPYSMSQLKGAIAKSVEEFAEGAADTPGLEWGAPKKTQGDLTSQYMKWRALISYDQLEPVRQNQLDLQCDAYMRSNDKFDEWWVDNKKRRPRAEISATRPAGRIGAAMKKRIAGITGQATPLENAVGKRKISALASRAGPFAKPPVRQKQKEEQPSPAQLRRAGTEEAYQKGVELGYWAE